MSFKYFGNMFEPQPKARLGGAFGYSKLISDLAIRAPAKVCKLNRLTLFRRKHFDGFTHSFRGNECHRHLINVGDGPSELRFAIGTPPFCFFAPYVVDGTTMRERSEKRS